jgi:poly-gamma-glutamate capsule biosynthesis protein CapA/YwtB (metallophosphatase superfamily)
MRNKLIVALIIAAMFLGGVLWFFCDRMFPARLLFWLPRSSQSVSPGIARFLQEETESYEVSSEEIEDDLSILFAGDISFGENYQKKSLFESRGYDYFLKELSPLLNRSDMVIANLETPLTDLTRSPFSGWKKYIHWGDVHKVPEVLKGHNIRFVSLANNHSMDYGMEGLQQTLVALKKEGIAWFGAGMSASKAAKPLRFHSVVNGRPFHLIVVSGFEYRRWYDLLYRFYARGKSGGVNRWTRKDAAKQIREIRKSDDQAFIVAFPHWGDNYSFKNKDQTKLAHALIEAGCDLAIGHGAHILQEIEQYKGKWILYSLGNFVFNSPGRYQKKQVDPFSLAVSLNVTDESGSLALILRLYPIFSDNRISNYQPRFVTDGELGRVRDIILQHSPDSENLGKELGIGKDEIGPFLTLAIEGGSARSDSNMSGSGGEYDKQF